MKVNKHFPFPFALTAIFLGFVGLTGSLSCRSSASGKGKTVFHYNEFAGIASLDPAFAKNLAVMWAVHQLYNTLVETDQEMHIAPSLATGWDVSPEGANDWRDW